MDIYKTAANLYEQTVSFLDNLVGSLYNILDHSEMQLAPVPTDSHYTSTSLEGLADEKGPNIDYARASSKMRKLIRATNAERREKQKEIKKGGKGSRKKG